MATYLVTVVNKSQEFEGPAGTQYTVEQAYEMEAASWKEALWRASHLAFGPFQVVVENEPDEDPFEPGMRH